MCGSIFLIATIRGQRRIPPNTLTSLHPQPSPVSTSRTDASADLFASATSERPCWRFAQENLIPTLSIRLWLLKQRLKTTGNQISAEKMWLSPLINFRTTDVRVDAVQPLYWELPSVEGFVMTHNQLDFLAGNTEWFDVPQYDNLQKLFTGHILNVHIHNLCIKNKVKNQSSIILSCLFLCSCD